MRDLNKYRTQLPFVTFPMPDSRCFYIDCRNKVLSI